MGRRGSFQVKDLVLLLLQCRWLWGGFNPWPQHFHMLGAWPKRFFKWMEDLNRHFSKEDRQMAKKHMKRCSALLIIREIEIKTTISYHLILVRTANIKKFTNNNRWRGCE